MDASRAEETSGLIANDENSSATQDNPRFGKKHLVVHVILACILFQSIAYYSLEVNINTSLRESSGQLKWNSAHTTVAVNIFQGMIYLNSFICSNFRKRNTPILSVGMYF